MTEYSNFRKDLLDLKDDYNLIFGKIIEKLDELEELKEANHVLREENNHFKDKLLFLLETKYANKTRMKFIEAENKRLKKDINCFQIILNEQENDLKKLKEGIETSYRVFSGLLNNCQ